MTLTITAKGQVTLRRSVLAHLGLEPGDRLEAVLMPGGKVELTLEQPKHDISAIFGMLHRPGRKPLTDEEVDEAVGQHLLDEDERIKRER